MQNARRRLSLVLLLVSTISACATPRGAPIQSEVLAGAEAEDAQFAVYPVTKDKLDTYAGWPATGKPTARGWLPKVRGPASPMIAAGDRISIRVWDSDPNSLLTPNGAKVVEMSKVEVTPAGTVFVPYVDEVYVAKMTPDEARQAIQTKLSAVVPSGQVQVALESGVQNTVDLVSGVNRPGSFPLPSRDITILSLISQGGGVAAAMRNPQIRLIRDGRLYAIGLDRIYADPSLNTTLRGGDQVFVEEDDRYFLALGNTGNEDIIYFTDESMSALDALSLARGLNDTRADPKGIMVLRSYPDKAVRSDGTGPEKARTVFTIDLTTADGLFSAGEFEIYPKDLVLVTESPLTATEQNLSILATAVGIGDKLRN